MKKADLAEMTIAELKALARKQKITVPGSAKKADIVKALLAEASPEKGTAVRRTGASPSAKTTGKTVRKTGPAKSSRSAPEKRTERRAAAAGNEGSQMVQERIEQAKYYAGTGHGAGGSSAYAELPSEYGEDRVVIMPRDPSVAFAYWEVTPSRLAREKEWFGWDSTLCIRIYDVTGVHFDGRNASAFYDQDIEQRFGSWYFHIGRPGHSFVADIGLRSGDGRFLVLARSNAMRMPAEGPADAAGGVWSLSDEEFREMYGFPEGMSSEDVREFWRIRREQGGTSPGMTPGASGKGRYQA